MCAINPKHQLHFKLSVYTSLDMSEQEFGILVLEKMTNLEVKLNQDMRLRWHIKEAE